MARFYQTILLCIVFVLFQSNAIPQCPYEGKTLHISKSLTECLNLSKVEYFGLNQVIRCFTYLVPSGQINNNMIYFESIDPSNTFRDLQKEDYKPCAKEYNKLLDLILAERADNEKQMKETAEKRKSMTKKQIIEDSIKYQSDICKGKIKYFTKEQDEKVSWTNVTYQGSNFTMYVHNKGDAVSSLILKWKAWENDELQALGKIIEKYMKKKNINDPSQLTFIDVGAQVGWYAMNLASKGYKVFAFEPFADNEYVIRKNICANPNANITYINAALGEKDKTCYLYSENNNKDDPVLICNDEMTNPAFFNRGATEVFKLDDFADLIINFVAIKMDIEGYEHNLMRGGRKIILNQKVPFIISEFSPSMLTERGGNPLEYLQEYVKAGYRISNTSFESGFFNSEQIEEYAKTNFEQIPNIYLIHNDAFN